MEDDTDEDGDPEMNAPWADPYNKPALKKAGRSGQIPAKEDNYMQDEDINEEPIALYQRELYHPIDRLRDIVVQAAIPISKGELMSSTRTEEARKRLKYTRRSY